MNQLATAQPNKAVILSHRRRISVFRSERQSILRIALLITLWLAIFAASLHTPPLLDDADATHAQAAQAMLHTHDFVTLRVDGIRYLEKAPLPYWIAALSMAAFGETAFATHLPLALTVLALAFLGYTWSSRAFGHLAAFYTALFTLTATGVFLFTRIFIPDALLALFLALALYNFLRALEAPTRVPHISPHEMWVSRAVRGSHAYAMWTTLALAVLTKGLVALVFFFGATLTFLILDRDTRQHLYRLKLPTGLLLFFVIAAPWHILAGLRNNGGAGGHGFFWFYFVNEHFLRFLGQRIPRDYNKLPTALYWSLHLVWLFPWSLFAPPAILIAYRKRREQLAARELDANGERLSRLELSRHRNFVHPTTFTGRTVSLLGLFSALVLVFFSLSTNQEYYTFPAYLPLLTLLAAALATPQLTRNEARATTFAFAAFTTLGLAIAGVLAYGLYASRHLPFAPDIGAVLAHRGVGQYTLSMSHFFDLTAASFAALRLPAAIALTAFAIGPAVALLLRGKLQPALITVALTSAAFLLAAHIALVRFTPMLSSQNFAATLQSFGPDTQVLLYGDQAYGSSIPFYLHRQVQLVDGRSTSMLFGSTFPDAPPIFLTPQQLAATWGTGPRKLLFVPAEKRDEVANLLTHTVLLQETSGKQLLTDRTLDQPR